MQLPISISPNPLFTSTIEIRFSSSLNKTDLFKIMSKNFSSELPLFEEGKIPQELKDKEESFKYAPDYLLKNDDFSLAFSTKSISFEHISEYKLWPNYFQFIKQCLTKIFNLDIIEKIERCGVRYGSILEEKFNTADILIDLPNLKINNLQSNFIGFQAEYTTSKNKLYLQISPNVKLVKSNITRKGLYIDIDASFNGSLTPSEEVFKIIDNLHKEQKELFFGLLKKDFIETLNPKY